jgi:hypothetical protein
MELLFSFHYGQDIVAVNLYRVIIRVREHSIDLTEMGADNPSVWYVQDTGDIALLRSWLVGNALGGEIFVQGNN